MIWKEMNARIFQKIHQSAQELIRQIKEIVCIRGLKTYQMKNIVLRLWGCGLFLGLYELSYCFLCCCGSCCHVVCNNCFWFNESYLYLPKKKKLHLFWTFSFNTFKQFIWFKLKIIPKINHNSFDHKWNIVVIHQI